MAKKLNARQEVFNIVDQLKRKAGQFQNTLIRNVGDPVRYSVQKAPVAVQQRAIQTIGNPVRTTIQRSPVFNPQQFQFRPDVLAKPLPPKFVGGNQALTDYAQNQIRTPLYQGIKQMQQKGAGNKAMGALGIAQGIFSATPQGALFNIGTGTLAASARSLRTKEPFQKALTRSVLNPTSVGSEGLGLSGAPALAVDIATGGPKGTVKTVQSLGQFGKNIRNLKGINPRAFKMHPDDLQEAKSALDILRGQVKAGTADKRYALKTVQNLLDAYAPGYKTSKNAKAYKVLENLIQTNEELPRDLRTPLPKMGLVGKGDEAIETAQLQKQSRIPSPETPQQGQQISRAISGGSSSPKGGSSSSNRIIAKLNPKDPYFNVERLKVSPEVKATVKQVVEDSKPAIEQVVGRTLSNSDVINLANTSSKVIRKTIGQEETLAYESALLKARQLLASQAREGTVTQEYVDNLIMLKSQATDIARKLQSFSINADPKGVSAKEAILEAVLKVNTNADEILKRAQGVDFNDVKQATAFYRQFVKPSLEEWVDLLRYNSMLSSPNTHIINTFSNLQGSLLVAPIEKTILGGVDFLKSAVTGKDRQYYAGEGVKYAEGALESIGAGAHRFADVLRGKALINNPDVRNIPLTTGGAGRVAETALSLPLRLLEGMDQFFSTIVAGGAKKSLAYRQSKGVKVSNLELKASQEAAYRLFRQDLLPEGQGHILGVLDSGAQALFSLRTNKNPAVRVVAKFSVPFIKTPVNILKQGVEYSPAGFSTLWGATNKTEQFTKAMMGTAIGISTALLLGSDRMTWSEPADQKKKNAFRAAGLQPYSVKVGDQWVSYQKLHPAIAFNLALTAGVKDALDNKKISEGDAAAILTGLSSWTSFFADQSYLKNMGDFIAATKGDVEGPLRYVSNYPQQLIPGRALLGWVNRIIDPYQRQVPQDKKSFEKQLLYITLQIPGLAQKLPPRVGPDGQPIKNQNRFLNAVSPVRVSTEDSGKREDFETLQEIARLNQASTEASKTRKTRAQTLYDELKALSPEEANAQAKALKQEDPETYEALKDIAQSNKLGLNEVEKSIKSLGVTDGSRAKFIASRLKELKTSEEKNALIKEWRRKKIISKDVLLQLKEMKKKGEL